MKERTERNFFKAGNGTARAISLVATITIALMLSVGITIAQQTQGNTVVDQIATTEISDVGCPCHQGNNDNQQTISGGGIVCPGIIDAINYITDLGEAWYNNFVQSAAQQSQQYYLLQLFSLYREGASSLSIGGGTRTSPVVHRGSISSSVIGSEMTPYSHDSFGFLSWDTLQIRFAEILAYNDGTGPVPSFWTAHMAEIYTSTGFCLDAEDCFWAYAVGQTILAAFMAMSSAGQSYSGLQLWLEAQVLMGAALVLCLQGSGWTP
jgi:hypothetical protein